LAARHVASASPSHDRRCRVAMIGEPCDPAAINLEHVTPAQLLCDRVTVEDGRHRRGGQLRGASDDLPRDDAAPDVRGLSPTQAGLSFLSFSVPFAVGDQLTKYVGGLAAWAVMSGALAVAGLGTALMGVTGGRGPFFAASVLSGLGLGVAWAYANAVSQAVVPPAEAGVASGLVLTVLVSVGGVGVAVASCVIESRRHPKPASNQSLSSGRRPRQARKTGPMSPCSHGRKASRTARRLSSAEPTRTT
jgi:hypothetical protein